MFAATLGELPEKTILSELPGTSDEDSNQQLTQKKSTQPKSNLVNQASSLLALLNTKSELSEPSTSSKMWLGEGIGSISKKTFEKMRKWEFMDLNEFRIRTPLERVSGESETQKIVVLPGFEVSQAKTKPIRDIVTWMNCFCRYTAAMASVHPKCTLGFMSHILTVLKAYVEVEDPAWRLYDVSFREKMAATGVKSWKGMDVQLYQEICGAKLRKRQLESGSGRIVEDKGFKVCWKFNNDGGCKFGSNCKFPHLCEICGEGHAKVSCGRFIAQKKRKL